MIYRFDHAHAGTIDDVARIVGGKGASLWAMTAQLGLPTPPGFTIGCAYQRRFQSEGLSPELLAGVDSELHRLGETLGRGFGDPGAPLLVAVRSGAPVSMPGMMDTILNVGLTPETVEGLALQSGDRAFALDAYQRFLAMFAGSVIGGAAPATHPEATDEAALENAVATLSRHIANHLGAGILADSRALLQETIAAVLRSSDSAPARTYREREGLPEDLGTAVTVQAMVFGNMDAASGTGVVFSRDPSTGAPGLTGDWMRRAQGEDVVAGNKATRPVSELSEATPGVRGQLEDVAKRLELFYQDMVDIEFTVESGRLWVLQARAGKRSAAAAARIAVDLARDERFAVDEATAVARIPQDVLRGERALSISSSGEAIGSGLGAAPGAASGRVVMTPEAAVELAEDGEPVILVRRETSPADVHGMAVARGVLTGLGGLMSHAAVVARDWGLPAVVGAEALSPREDGFDLGDCRVKTGDTISIDGSSGEIFLGAIGTQTRTDDCLETLRAWARQHGNGAAGPSAQ